MVPSLRGMTDEERLERLRLPSLEENRERGDLIVGYRVIKGIKTIERDDLFIWNARNTGRQRY